MPRSARSAKLETRTARLRLPVRGKPYTVRISPGIRLGYRRTQSAGTWSVLVADGAGGGWLKQFALADDFETADGTSVLDFWQAQDRARTLARGNETNRPATVGEAVERYEADLRARGADRHNATRLRGHVAASLTGRTIATLTARELRHWRDGLLASGLSASTVKRVCNCLKAALSAAAAQDARIGNRDAWHVGLASLPDSERARNVILGESDVRAIVAAAYTINSATGLMVEVAAVTGSRSSQLARLVVGDLQDGDEARLMMPSARKGRGQKRVTRAPVPIPQGLATRLREASAGQPFDAPLLTRPSGGPWRAADHRRPFRDAVAKAGLDPAHITIYALRHSSIVRQLLAGVPIRVVAQDHDTSVVMLERTYSRNIGDHSDAIVRRALIDVVVSS